MNVPRWLPLSLAVNLLLAGVLVWRGRAGHEPRGSRGPAGAPAPELEAVGVDSPSGSPAAPPSSVPFHWDQLDTADWFAYRDGLLAIGCPPHVVRDILSPLVTRHYAGKCREWIRPYSEDFWNRVRPPVEQSLDELKKAVEALEAEKEELLERLLGALRTDSPESETVDAAGSHRLSFLPEDLRPEVLKLLAGQEERSRQSHQRKFSSSEDRRKAFRELQEQFDSELLALMSPEDLAEVKLRQSPMAHWRHLQGVELTQDELRALVGAAEEARGQARGRAEVEEATQKAVEAVLGTERSEALRRAENPQFQRMLTMMDRLGLPRDTAADLWKAEEELAKAARSVADLPTLTVSQRQERLAEYRRAMSTIAGNTLGGDRGRDTWERSMADWMDEVTRVPEVDPVAELGTP